MTWLKQHWFLTIMLGLLVFFVFVYVSEPETVKVSDFKCSDEYEDAGEYIETMAAWASDYLKENPEATNDEVAEARVAFLREQGCENPHPDLTEEAVSELETEEQLDAANIMDAIKYAESQRPKGIAEDATMEEINNNLYVKHIRTALNGYLDGTNNGVEEGAADVSDGELNCGLDSFDKDYYRSKFFVWDVANGDYGGVITNIVFIDKPDSIFWAWVYQLAGEEYVLRGFCKNGPAEDAKDTFNEFVDYMISENKIEYSL